MTAEPSFQAPMPRLTSETFVMHHRCPEALSWVLPFLTCVAGTACSPSPSGPCSPCPSSAAAGLAHVGVPRSEKVEQLAKRRVEAARKRLRFLRDGFDRGAVTLDDLFVGFREVAFAARDSGLHGETLRRILAEYRDAVVSLKDLTLSRLHAGAANEDAMSRVELALAEAELWLAEADDSL